ncbi:MAG: fumarylacetoacetate hydrolase family protein [Candidatus Hydrogenedentota bacterium]
MRVCRFVRDGNVEAGFYFDDFVVPLKRACNVYGEETGATLPVVGDETVLELLCSSEKADTAYTLGRWFAEQPKMPKNVGIPLEAVTLRTPIPDPPKILLLAGNYAAHIEEEGQVAVERRETFPYVFIKPRTTLNHPGAKVPIPACSPDTIDYECELAIVVGKRAKAVPEEAALGYVAGYTVVNDISDRKFRPNPGRREREKDAFFDWLHGKWHDGFCPVGPAISSARWITDPQSLSVELKVNGEVRQSGSTGQMVFPVAAIVAFISQWITLEPGDIIATGTPAGVGAASGRFLKAGDVLEASIENIGTLRNTMA